MPRLKTLKIAGLASKNPGREMLSALSIPLRGSWHRLGRSTLQTPFHLTLILFPYPVFFFFFLTPSERKSFLQVQACSYSSAHLIHCHSPRCHAYDVRLSPPLINLPSSKIGAYCDYHLVSSICRVPTEIPHYLSGFTRLRNDGHRDQLVSFDSDDRTHRGHHSNSLWCTHNILSWNKFFKPRAGSKWRRRWMQTTWSILCVCSDCPWWPRIIISSL